MQVFFLSEQTAALSVGGMHVGLCDMFERSLRLNPEDRLFVEILPVGGYLPVRFVFDGEFLFSPPPHIQLYFFGESVAVYASDFCRCDQTMRVLRQKRIGNVLCTLYLQGKLQLSLENGSDFHLVELPDGFCDCEIEGCGDDVLLLTPDRFALVGTDGTVKLLTEGTVLEREGALKAKIPFRDSMAHTAVCEWTDGKLTACAIQSGREANERTVALAFFESILIGADPTPFLAEELLPKKDELKEYLGDYRSVVLTRKPDEAGLVYERKPQVFDVRPFHIELKNGRICNLYPVENEDVNT